MDDVDTLLLDNEPFEVSRAATWLDSRTEDAGLSPRAIAALQVVLDEVLNNIMVHGYADLESHKIEVRLTIDTGAATLEFFDDGTPFDPTQHEVSAPGDLQTTRIGGLGLVFVRRLMDDVAYERLGDRNHLTVRKFVSS